ncbi:MAG: phosphoribosylformylglycinamidine synthase-associated small membrane protein [Hyphomicrobiaceae bacterium]
MSLAPEETKRPDAARSDAAQALRYLAIKAAIFILIPLVAAGIAVWWRFG